VPPQGSAEALQVDQAIREGVDPVDLNHCCSGCLLKGCCLNGEDLRLDAVVTDPGGVEAEGLGGSCGHGALRWFALEFYSMGGTRQVPLADQNRTAQFGSVRQLTQAHQVRLLLTQNRSLPWRCSTTTTGSPAI